MPKKRCKCGHTQEVYGKPVAGAHWRCTKCGTRHYWGKQSIKKAAGK